MAEAIVSVVQRRRPEHVLELTGDEIGSAFDRVVRQAEELGKDRPAFAKAVLKYVRDEHHAPVSKTDLAHELAEMTIRRIDEAGSLYDAATADRPLLRRLWTWLREAK